MNSFESNGYQYTIDDFGIIHQVNPEPFVYDTNYTSVYDTEAYQKRSDMIQALRVAFIQNNTHAERILDFGAGNGAFCRFAKDHFEEVIAYDVASHNIPGVNNSPIPFVPVDCYTFHDSLEHLPHLDIVRELPCRYVSISLPYCHYHYCGKEWFDKLYKHRKPNEHLHHFDESALRRFMEFHGWKAIQVGKHEDIVRKSPGYWQNILSIIFERI